MTMARTTKKIDDESPQPAPTNGNEHQNRKPPQFVGLHPPPPSLTMTHDEAIAASLLHTQPSSEPLPGLFLYENFITEQEEAALLQMLDINPTSTSTSTVQEEGEEDNRAWLPWKPSRFNGSNRGKRWGVHCNLRDRRVEAPAHALPEVLCHVVFPKLARLASMKGCTPNEANAIEYRRRQGHWLQAHVDDRKLSREPIANLSLAGDCTMTYRNQAMQRNTAGPEQRVHLKRRCLQVLTGKARYDFSHGIANQDLLSDRRVSVTMRESPITTMPSALPSVKDVFSKATRTTATTTKG
jgi:alkylated DNA repair dioxygenase AlkB